MMRKPGSDMPGVPASLTNAITSPFFQALNKAFEYAVLVKVMKALQRFAYGVMLQQETRCARVFGQYKIYRFQYIQRP